MNIDHTFNGVKSIEGRDNGIALVTGNNLSFVSEVLIFILFNIPYDWLGPFEEIRRLATNSGIEPPEHPNAWGAVSSRAIKLGLIVNANKQVGMKSIKSHARKTPVYSRL